MSMTRRLRNTLLLVAPLFVAACASAEESAPPGPDATDATDATDGTFTDDGPTDLGADAGDAADTGEATPGDVTCTEPFGACTAAAGTNALV